MINTILVAIAYGVNKNCRTRFSSNELRVMLLEVAACLLNYFTLHLTQMI